MGHVVILMGSPRPAGNTARLCQALARGASLHHTVDIISVPREHVSGCTGCNACFRDETHRCVQKDDMQELYQRMSGADVLVIATPLYFYGISSQLKAVIDRLHNPIRNTFQVKKLALLAVGGNENPKIFRPLVDMYQITREYFHLEDGGVLTVPGVRDREDLTGHPALEKARALGEAL